MADAALWAAAAEPLLGVSRGAVERMFANERREAATSTLDASLIADPLLALLTDCTSPDTAWTGTGTELLRALTGKNQREPLGWPTRANVLSAELRVIAPNLRAVGVSITHPTSHHPKNFILWRDPKRDGGTMGDDGSGAAGGAP